MESACARRPLPCRHGSCAGMRNADHYFRTATAAAFLGGALGDTVVIAPHFINARDPRQADEVVWPEGRVNWRDGAGSLTHPGVTSFDLVDRPVRGLADRHLFPHLKHIVVAGHSAGGQFATRYEMANKVDGTLDGVTPSYVSANPSSYAWPSAERPLPVGDASPVDAYREALGDDGEKLHADFRYGAFDAAKRS